MADRLAIAMRSATAVLLLGALAACDRSPQDQAVPAPEPAATPAPPGSPAPDATTPSPEGAPPTEAPAAPAQPEATPPPPEEPSAVPKPTAAPGEPPVEAMLAARSSAKITVPVSLRYQFDTSPQPNQPVTLHLAAVPRASGSNLKVTVKGAEGLQLAATPLRVQKASATNVYRQQLSITRTAAGPQDLLVLVTMDTPEGSGFGYFSIPLADGKTAQKLDSVKQR